MSQMKEQNTIPVKKKLHNIETSNLDTQFKILVIRMLNEFKGRVDELREILNCIKRTLKQ